MGLGGIKHSVLIPLQAEKPEFPQGRFAIPFNVNNVLLLVMGTGVIHSFMSLLFTPHSACSVMEQRNAWTQPVSLHFLLKVHLKQMNSDPLSNTQPTVRQSLK